MYNCDALTFSPTTYQASIQRCATHNLVNQAAHQIFDQSMDWL